jgi:hypothetical protein
MDAKIIFDATTKPFPWVIAWSPLLGCAIACILLLLNRIGWIRQSRFTLLACLFGAVSGLLGAVYFPLSWFQRHRNVTGILASGQFDTVQGSISDFQAEPRDRSSAEHFSVAGRQFAYSSQSFITPCFNQTALEHGPLRPGMVVRISFTNDCILRIEELN